MSPAVLSATYQRAYDVAFASAPIGLRVAAAEARAHLAGIAAVHRAGRMVRG